MDGLYLESHGITICSLSFPSKAGLNAQVGGNSESQSHLYRYGEPSVHHDRRDERDLAACGADGVKAWC